MAILVTVKGLRIVKLITRSREDGFSNKTTFIFKLKKTRSVWQAQAQAQAHTHTHIRNVNPLPQKRKNI